MPLAISSSVETDAFMSEPEISIPCAEDKAQRPHRHAADSDQMAALAGDQILLNMLTGRIFHARFLRKIWIAHAREGAYNEN